MQEIGAVKCYNITNLGHMLVSIRSETGTKNSCDTLYDMARKLGISSSNLSMIENGMIWISDKFINDLLVEYPLARKYKDKLRKFQLDSNNACKTRK